MAVCTVFTNQASIIIKMILHFCESKKNRQAMAQVFFYDPMNWKGDKAYNKLEDCLVCGMDLVE